MIYVLSIETDAGTYQHGFHLGTDSEIARPLHFAAMVRL